MKELELPEHLQPPQANGEVVFDAPWQSRVFAIAVALHEAGVFKWFEFQASLIATIERAQRDGGATQSYAYFDHFSAALERLLAANDVLPPQELQHLSDAFAARPHGHDHDHDHDHDHA